MTREEAIKLLEDDDERPCTDECCASFTCEECKFFQALNMALDALKENDHVIRDCRTCANREVTAYHEKRGEFGWCKFVDFSIKEDDFCSRWKAKKGAGE